MKKILILYGSYGGGHLSAAKSIKEYIDTNYSDTETLLVDCIEYVNKYINKLSTKAFSTIAKNARWVWKKVYYSSDTGSISKVSNTSNRLMAIKLNKLLQNFKPDIIVSTHPFSSQMCAILRKKRKIDCKIFTVVTDYEAHNQWVTNINYIDTVFIGCNEMIDHFLENGIRRNKLLVTGIPVSPKFLNSYNKDNIFMNFELNPNKKTILFFAGGEFGFGQSIIFDIFKILLENFKDIQIIAIAGKNEKTKKHFAKLIEQYNTQKNVRLLDYTDKISELMSIADLAISKSGGLTTTECLVSNLPMLIINPIAGQEEANARYVETAGAGKWLKKDDDIFQTLNYIINGKNVLDDMKENTKKIAKPNAIKAICSTILNQ